jgi:hypothetical protein
MPAVTPNVRRTTVRRKLAAAAAAAEARGKQQQQFTEYTLHKISTKNKPPHP